MQTTYKIVSIFLITLFLISGAIFSNNYFSNNKLKQNTIDRKINILFVDAIINTIPINWNSSIDNIVKLPGCSPVFNLTKTKIIINSDVAKSKENNFDNFKALKAIIVINYHVPWKTLGTPRLSIFIVNNGVYSIKDLFNITNIAYNVEYSKNTFNISNLNPINSSLNFSYARIDSTNQNITFIEQHIIYNYMNVSMKLIKTGGCE